MYPRTANEIEDLLKKFIKDFLDAKKFENELKDWLESSFAQVIQNDLTLIANGDHEIVNRGQKSVEECK